MFNWGTKPYTKAEFTESWLESQSLAECLRKLGYKNSGGGSYDTIKRAAEDLGLNRDHMLGQAHLRNRTHNWSKGTPLEELLVKGKYRGKLGKRLMREGVLKSECSKCGITEWNGEPAPLELDHLDGDNTNNEISNLRILCCNCHAQTENYKGRNMKMKRPKKIPLCEDCGGQKSCSRYKFCRKCSYNHRSNKSS